MTGHNDARTERIDADGISYAYRRFGAAAGTPVLFLQHFRGGMDHWDPLVTDGLAAGRPVILFNNAGVASSSGDTPETIEALADHAAVFLHALGVEQADILGFSIGGHVAQALAQRHPKSIRRLIIAGSRPRGGRNDGIPADMLTVATRHHTPTLEDFLYLFFAPSATSQAAGRAFWDRRHRRNADTDPPTSEQTMKAQIAAIMDWRDPHGEPYAYLHDITAPALVVNGHTDIMAPTINSWLLAQHLPNAQLIVYPDSGHGAIFQYADLFVAHAARFLDAPTPFA